MLDRVIEQAREAEIFSREDTPTEDRVQAAFLYHIGLTYRDFEVNMGEYIFEEAEAQGYDWPFSCRAGACANCAAILREGELEMDMQPTLSPEEVAE